MELAQDHLKNAKKDMDVIDAMKKKYKKDPFLNPYRTKNMYHMQTTGQIMMNLPHRQEHLPHFLQLKTKYRQEDQTYQSIPL